MSEARKEYQKKYTEENKEKIKAYKKQWYEANKNKVIQNSKKHYEKNKSQIAEYKKKYYEDHKEVIAMQHKQYYEDHKEEINNYKKSWYEENKDKVLEQRKQYYEQHKDEINAQHRAYNKAEGAIQKKIRNCYDSDMDKGRECNINYDFCVELLQQQNYLCACCNKTVKMVWETPYDPEQFSINRKDNSVGHLMDNVEITCLKCNNILH